MVVFVVSTLVLLIWGRAKQGDDRAGNPLPRVYDRPADADSGLLPT